MSGEAQAQAGEAAQAEALVFYQAEINGHSSAGLYSVCSMAAGRRRDNSGIDCTAGAVSGIQPGNADNE